MSFPEILEKMENIKYLDLVYTDINDLPFSIGSLFVVVTILTVNRGNKLLELQSSVFVLPKLGNLEVNYCRKLAQIQNGESHETMSSSVKEASFSHCYLAHKFLATLLPSIGNVFIP